MRTPADIPPAEIWSMPFTYSSGARPLEGYTIKHGIDRGGFGEVYYAVSDAGKEVALKLVQRHLEIEQRGVGQCLNLKHAHLVTIYDIRRSESDECWIVMEYMRGQQLAQVLEQHPGGLPADRTRRWFASLCNAVSYLHGKGIVHRDLKPANIFIEDDELKIGDYGLTKFVSTSRRSGQTESVGTVHYMAPEVACGSYGKEIDVYAAGVILYEMVTGKVPFDGQSVGEILMKHLTAEPDLFALPAAYRPVVARALLKDPLRRYPSPEAMREELFASLEGRDVSPQAIAATLAWRGDTARAGVGAQAASLGPVAQVGGQPAWDGLAKVLRGARWVVLVIAILVAVIAYSTGAVMSMTAERDAAIGWWTALVFLGFSLLGIGTFVVEEPLRSRFVQRVLNRPFSCLPWVGVTTLAIWLAGFPFAGTMFFGSNSHLDPVRTWFGLGLCAAAMAAMLSVSIYLLVRLFEATQPGGGNSASGVAYERQERR